MTIALIVSVVLNVLLVFLLWKKRTVIADLDAEMAIGKTAINTLTERAVTAEKKLESLFTAKSAELTQVASDVKKVV